MIKRKDDMQKLTGEHQGEMKILMPVGFPLLKEAEE